MKRCIFLLTALAALAFVGCEPKNVRPEDVPSADAGEDAGTDAGEDAGVVGADV